MYNIDTVFVIISPVNGSKVDRAEENRYADSLNGLEALVYGGLVLKILDERLYRTLTDERVPIP